MPELPEVEVVRRTLEPSITGRLITNIIIRYDGIIMDDADFVFYNS